jgi:hypothetical protein
MLRKHQERSDRALPAAALTLRYVEGAGSAAVARLAALDSAPPPTGPWLVAEVEGRALAALGLGDGAFIADPFSRTAELRPLLELRAYQLRARARDRARSPRRAAPRPRPALAAGPGGGFLLAPREHL